MNKKSPKEPSARNAVAAHCAACGCQFRARRWRDNMSCPQCGSGSVEPVMAPGGAVDYYVANRKEGHARADVRFAQWAKWTELITPNQYERAFVKQNRQIQNGQKPDPIHEIIVDENWIGENQAIGLLEFLSLRRPSESDDEFLTALRQKSDVDWGKVKKVRRLQQKAAQKCHEIPPICQLLMERRVISETQMLTVLKQLNQNETGDLHNAREMAGERKSIQRVKRLKKAITPSKTTARYAAIVVALLLLGIGAWKWQAAQGRKVVVQCRNCNEISQVNWSKSFPVRCPNCGKKTAYYAMKCENGHIFTVRNPYQRIITCPTCGTKESHPLKEDEIP